MFREIRQCRVCGNEELAPVLDLGKMYFTGYFLRGPFDEAPSGPLEVVKCHTHDKARNVCGLLQLKHDYNLHQIYNYRYGYRSGLNKVMVAHLNDIVVSAQKFISLKKGDCVIDIGSNDGTLLKGYAEMPLNLIGVDPIADKFQGHYPSECILVPEFFSEDNLWDALKGRKAKIITSIAMFYDLLRPLDFMKDIYHILDKEGIWVFEQSYLPDVLKNISYDTICHEHTEYYAFKQIKWMMDKAGFKAVKVERNSMNGGSLCITAAKAGSHYPECRQAIRDLLEEEERLGLDTLHPFRIFRSRVFQHRDQLRNVIGSLKKDGKRMAGYGASTKGNVILQFCQLSKEDIHCIIDINEEKLGCLTPGTNIPIVSEHVLVEETPDILFVLPWYFSAYFKSKEEHYLRNGGTLLFPLPEVGVITLSDTAAKVGI